MHVLSPARDTQPSPGGVMIHVAIVEDDAVTRRSLSRIVDEARGMRCIAACATGEEALKQLPESQPEVVVMDINLPQMSGIECVRRLREQLPKTQVLMLTVYEDSDSIFRALRAGASGYLLKRSEPEQLLEGIRDVLHGGSPMTSQIARKVVQAFRASEAAENLSMKLTEREAEVLDYLAKGYANKEIAEKLGLSLPTVRSHLRSIYDKLHVRSRTEAVAKYLK
ncbi:MAG TPA: response regulator transcription factor [Verrucomicrobiae bacterium]|nr:response regulator transcription factor [Verrucomicrobiae bacterium]